MEIEKNIIKFDDLTGRHLPATVLPNRNSRDFVISISTSRKYNEGFELEGRIPEDAKNTFENMMSEAQKIIAHWVLEKNGVLSDFDISRDEFIELIKYNKINTMFIKGHDFIIQSVENGDTYNLIINKEDGTIKEENHFRDGGSTGSILYNENSKEINILARLIISTPQIEEGWVTYENESEESAIERLKNDISTKEFIVVEDNTHAADIYVRTSEIKHFYFNSLVKPEDYFLN